MIVVDSRTDIKKLHELLISTRSAVSMIAIIAGRKMRAVCSSRRYQNADECNDGSYGISNWLTGRKS